MAKIKITPRDRPAGASRAASIGGVGGTSAFRLGIRE
jgi:hypothetical protein